MNKNKCFCSLPYCGGYVIVDAEIKIHSFKQRPDIIVKKRAYEAA